jgi:hypothetical protein
MKVVFSSSHSRQIPGQHLDWPTTVSFQILYNSFFLPFDTDRLCGRVVKVLATDPEARVRFPAVPKKKKGMGLERGPLSLVSTTEELLDRKVAASV